MFRRRKPPIRFPRYPLQWPWTLLWAAGFVLATAALLAVGFLVAQPVPTEKPGPWDELATTARMTGPAVAIAVAALAAMALCFRRMWLDWLALGPGRIEVERFIAGAALADADVAQLTLAFRQRLAELHLHAPASAPGQLADADFLDVLGASGVDSRNWLGSAVALLRATKPRHAWQIRGVLIRRDLRPRCGLTIQVARLPSTANPPITVWGTTWDEAVRHAADHATAAILPRTRRCVNQWSAWRRYRMGGRLLGNYEHAVELEAARRYDEALDAYYKAVEDDPMNMALRLRIGLLQERMGLYLDAFATYQGLIDVADERHQKRRTRERRRARNERRRADIVARYRRIVLLGGSEFAEQWHKAGAADGCERARHTRRRRLRARLRRPIEKLLAPVEKDRSRRGTLSPRQVLCGPGSEQAADLRRDHDLVLELRELLALAALNDRGDLTRRLWRHRGDRRMVLSQESVRLTRYCVEVRLERVQDKLANGGTGAWPPKVDRLDKKVRRLELNTRFNRYHEYYNAACLYALPLMDDELRNDADHHRALRRRLTRSAVEWLERATTSADSAYIAGQRDWLLVEDPDLDGLRTRGLFKDFEANHFPSKEATPPRPRHTKTLESSRYVKAILEATALAWENAWHERARRASRNPSVHELLGWWKQETKAWGLIRDVALNNRHWPTRVAMLRDVQEYAEEHELAPVEIGFPSYADDPLPGHDRIDVDAAYMAAHATEEHLHRIGRALPDPEAAREDDREIAEIGRWQSTLRELDTRGREPRQYLLNALCDEHAALWQLLREWVVADPGKADGHARRFSKQKRRTRHVCRGAAAWWRRYELVPVMAQRGAAPVLIVGRSVRNGSEATPVG
jgi:hypothetical protein